MTNEMTAASAAAAALTDAELASRMRLAVMRLGRRLRTQASSDLTPSQTSALSSVERLGPLTLGELSTVEGVRPPTLTKVVAALEEQGLVARHTDPSDRRVARVEVTAAGSKLLARSRSRTDAYLALRVAGLDADERDALVRAVAVIEAILESDE